MAYSDNVLVVLDKGGTEGNPKLVVHPLYVETLPTSSQDRTSRPCSPLDSSIRSDDSYSFLNSPMKKSMKIPPKSTASHTNSQLSTKEVENNQGNANSDSNENIVIRLRMIRYVP